MMDNKLFSEEGEPVNVSDLMQQNNNDNAWMENYRLMEDHFDRKYLCCELL